MNWVPSQPETASQPGEGVVLDSPQLEEGTEVLWVTQGESEGEVFLRWSV